MFGYCLDGEVNGFRYEWRPAVYCPFILGPMEYKVHCTQELERPCENGGPSGGIEDDTVQGFSYIKVGRDRSIENGRAFFSFNEIIVSNRYLILTQSQITQSIMRFLSILGFLAATSMAAQVTVHNKCSTAVWLRPDSAGATGTVSFLIFFPISKILLHTRYIPSPLHSFKLSQAKENPYLHNSTQHSTQTYHLPPPFHSPYHLLSRPLITYHLPSHTSL